LVRSVIEQFENYAKVNRKLPAETAVQLGQIEEPSKLADAVAANVNIKVSDKQALLAELDPVRRLEMAFAFMEGELGVMQVEKKIRSRVKRQMEKTQREYYLNEQLKAIQRELGQCRRGRGGRRARRAGPQDRAHQAQQGSADQGQFRAQEIARHAPMSAEATVSRNYLDVLLALPWGKKSKLKHDITEAERDPRRGPLWAGEGQGADRRISGGPGPHQPAQGPRSCASSARPASGKTSLGRRRACHGREFVRQSAWRRPRRGEIRATAAPISARCRARSSPTSRRRAPPTRSSCSTRIDKLGQDFRGDPASALLEVSTRAETAGSRTIIWRSTTTSAT